MIRIYAQPKLGKEPLFAKNPVGTTDLLATTDLEIETRIPTGKSQNSNGDAMVVRAH